MKTKLIVWKEKGKKTIGIKIKTENPNDKTNNNIKNPKKSTGKK
jgi:hypothetical protein